MQRVETSLNPDRQIEINAARNEALTNFTLSVLSSLETGLTSVDKNPIKAFKTATPVFSRKILSSIFDFDIDSPEIQNDKLKRRTVENFLTEGMIETVTAVLTKAARKPYQILNEEEGSIFRLITTAKTANGKALTPETLRSTLRSHFFNRTLEGQEKVTVKTAEVVYRKPTIVFDYDAR